MKSNRCIGKASSDRVERIVPPTIVQAVPRSPPSSILAFHVAARRRVRSGTSDASARGCAQAPRFSQARAHSFIARMVVNHARPNDVTEGYAADWTVAQLREPAQRIADRIEAR